MWYVIYFSYPFLLIVKFETIEIRDVPKADAKAATLPPPGVGVDRDICFIKLSIVVFENLFFGNILFSIIFSSILNFSISFRPNDCTATFKISDSGTPNSFFCNFKKYNPVLINAFFGTNPTISLPVTLTPLFRACFLTS